MDAAKQPRGTRGVMESTGVSWRPIYAVLEGHFVLIVGNARHIKNVPGRKTDVKDAAWIADLVRHGLIAQSYVPPQPVRELRDLLRYCRKLVDGQAGERNHLLKLLETANVKLVWAGEDEPLDGPPQQDENTKRSSKAVDHSSRGRLA